MYWGFGLLPEASKKWKVRPTASVLEMLIFRHSTGQGQGVVFGAFVLSDTSKNKN